MLPSVVSRDEWEVARKALLVKEKAFTKQRDALNAERRMLPMVEIDKDYVFAGPDGGGAHGKARQVDLFNGRRQLILVHFMFDPSWDTLADVSRAPLAKIEAYKAERGWTFPWYSSFGSDFNYDFHVTLDEARGGSLSTENGQSQENPGRSYFLRVDDRVFHTYSVFARGMESVGGSYYFLDETVLGRQRIGRSRRVASRARTRRPPTSRR